MNTLCLPPTPDALQKAAMILRDGGLVAFPTETVYGLGANALNAAAVAGIFKAKDRPQDNPLIVHISQREQALPLCHVSGTAQRLMDMFFPGPLTLLMKKKAIVPDITTAGLDSVGIRMPSHPAARAMLETVQLPIAAPSANRSGKPSPTTAAHVLSDMAGRIPLILDGGACQVGVESTVLDVTGDIPMILRPGGVTREMLLTVLQKVDVAPSVLAPLKEGERALSPGMRYKHYAPEGALTLVDGAHQDVMAALAACYDKAKLDGKRAAIFAFLEDKPFLGERYVLSLGSRRRPEEMAGRLFALLRQMDEEKITAIFSVVVDTRDIGLAIMNRLGRAAGFHLINAQEVLE